MDDVEYCHCNPWVAISHKIYVLVYIEISSEYFEAKFY